jgi:hypothetical protein
VHGSPCSGHGLSKPSPRRLFLFLLPRSRMADGRPSKATSQASVPEQQATRGAPTAAPVPGCGRPASREEPFASARLHTNIRRAAALTISKNPASDSVVLPQAQSPACNDLTAHIAQHVQRDPPDVFAGCSTAHGSCMLEDSLGCPNRASGGSSLRLLPERIRPCRELT